MEFIFSDYPNLVSVGYCTQEKKFLINGLFLPLGLGQYGYENSELKAWIVEVNLTHIEVMDIINRCFGTLDRRLAEAGKREFFRQDFIKLKTPA